MTGHGQYHATGVFVDRSTKPNRVYTVDAGNNRILGFASLGTCADDPERPCTNDTDCPDGSCAIDEDRDADLIFGQPDAHGSACNGDNNFGYFRPPTASTLCLMRYPEYPNVAEQWRANNIDVDTEGNLYVADVYNDRILKYNQPFSLDTTGGKGDTVADFVWGQPDMESNGYVGQVDALSIYISFYSPSTRGVTVAVARNPILMCSLCAQEWQIVNSSV